MSDPNQKDGNADTTEKGRTAPAEEIVSSLSEQAEDLCHVHDHETRVVVNLDINDEWFADYDDPNKANFDLVAVV